MVVSDVGYVRVVSSRRGKLNYARQCEVAKRESSPPIGQAKRLGGGSDYHPTRVRFPPCPYTTKPRQLVASEKREGGGKPKGAHGEMANYKRKKIKRKREFRRSHYRWEGVMAKERFFNKEFKDLRTELVRKRFLTHSGLV